MIAAFTWVSVVILIAGSLAVFAWFLVDVVRLARASRARREQGPDGAPGDEPRAGRSE